jgi:hypothetical protein
MDMGLVRALCRSAGGAVAMLLFAGAAFAAPDLTTDSASMNADDGADACVTDQACIDGYLWSLYERTPKLDTVKVPGTEKVTVKRKGKTTTVTRATSKLVGEDFTWKDPKAAELAGMSTMDYVIGGMNPAFRATLYRAMRVLDAAGFKPGIMCAFRDDYRQSIATGLKAQNDRSYHGGSLRGGYGHGVAADIVSVRGETRDERMTSTGQMWEWIDAHEVELGIGRPYRDHDPPHVGPLDGQEYAEKRLVPINARADARPKKGGGKSETRNDKKNDTHGGRTNRKNEQIDAHANHGIANRGIADHDIVRHGAANHDVVDRGLVDHGVANHGSANRSTVNHVTANHGISNSHGISKRTGLTQPGKTQQRLRMRTS